MTLYGLTKKSPFQLLMGYDLRYRTPISAHLAKAPANKDHLKILKDLREESKASHAIAAAEMKVRLDNPSYKPFIEGQKVWLEGKNIATTHPSAKLAPRHYGPYPISKVQSLITFKLRLPKSLSRIHPVFHASYLSPTKEPTEYGPPAMRPPPILVEGEEEYKIKQILQS